MTAIDSPPDDADRDPDDAASSLHRDERAQILPIVFFLGIAFFTSVVLVINTGRVTVGRVKAQNAVDAAAVSGATCVARGMNYVASNNITTSKLLALVVIVRALPDAFDVSLDILEAWKIAAEVMHAAANTPWTAWLHTVATVIEIKVQQEEILIEEVLTPIVDALVELLGVDDEDDGLVWLAIEGLDDLAEGIVYLTPVLAQVAANEVYGRNIAPEPGEGWMLPIYPAMPACEGNFEDYYDWTEHWVEEAADPIYVAGWITLTLSLFPLWYQASLEIQLNELFTGEESEITPSDPEMDAMKDIQNQINGINAEMVKVRDARTGILNDLVGLAQGIGLDVSTEAGQLGQIASRIETLQAEQAAGYETKEQAEAAASELQGLELQREGLYADLESRVRNALPGLDEDLRDVAKEKLDGDPNGITTRWAAQKDRLEELQQQLEDLDVEGAMGDRLDGGMPDDFDGGMGGLSGDVQERDQPHPWLLDPTGYPDSFSYLAVGFRKIRKPIVPAHFRRRLDASLVYAAARVFNTTEPDLWTADWRARLVKTEASMLANPLGSLPGDCEDAGGGGGMSELGDIDGLPSASEVLDIVDTLERMLGLLSKH